jgi:hypothetical protein
MFFELNTVLIFEQKQGTSRDSPCYKDAISFEQSYGLSVPVIYLDIRAYNERDLAGHISLKNWTQRVILRHDTTSFKRTCFLTTLKVLPDRLYVPNGLPYIAILNNNRKETF